MSKCALVKRVGVGLCERERRGICFQRNPISNRKVRRAFHNVIRPHPAVDGELKLVAHGREVNLFHNGLCLSQTGLRQFETGLCLSRRGLNLFETGLRLSKDGFCLSRTRLKPFET